MKKQGTPFTTSRTLFPTEPEGDTIQVRNVPPSLNRLSLSSVPKYLIVNCLSGGERGSCKVESLFLFGRKLELKKCRENILCAWVALPPSISKQ